MKSSRFSESALSPIWASWRAKSFLGIVVAAVATEEVIVGLQVMRLNVQICQVRALTEVDRAAGMPFGCPAPFLENESDRRGVWRVALECLFDGGPEFLSPVLVEQAQQLRRLGRGGLATLKGRIKQGFALRDGVGEAPAR